MSELAHLRTLVEDATEVLGDVSVRRLFGCDGFFVGESIFAMIWKDGRIGLRYTDDATWREALALEGAATWCPIPERPMAAWVLVPESFHDDPDALAAWAKKAHAQNRGVKEAKLARKKSAAVKKPAKKKV